MMGRSRAYKTSLHTSRLVHEAPARKEREELAVLVEEEQQELMGSKKSR